MKKTLFCAAILFSLFFGYGYAHETEIETEENVETEGVTEKEKSRLFGEKFQKPTDGKDFYNQMNFTAQIGPATYLNSLSSDTKKISAPSPIFFTPALGVIWPNYTFIAAEPTLYFYLSYYQWINGMAVPAEIESRTATTLSFILDVPVVFSFFFEKSKIQATIGPAAIMRFSFISSGISGNEAGTSGTVADDVKLINAFFWDNFRFLYVSTSFSWMFDCLGNTKAGPYISAFFPIGSIISSEGINGMMLSIGLKVSF